MLRTIPVDGSLHWLAVAVLVATGCVGSAGTGDPATVRVELIEPEASFPDAFSSISGLRELRDGRVMVADRLGQALIIVDLAAGHADTVGRQGGGPGEYNVPARLFPWLGDSTMLVDLGNTRYTPVASDGSFGVSVPLLWQDGETMNLIVPEGTDRRGNLYYQARGISLGPRGPEGLGGQPDSAVIVRWSPAAARADTVASLGLPQRRIERSGGNVAMATIPFSPSDDWAVSWDGAVCVARALGFWVEWIDSAGGTTSGPEIPYRPVTITQTDKDAWLADQANRSRGAMFIRVEADGGGGNVRAAPPPRSESFVGPRLSDADWPAVKPPFPPSAVSVTPDGEAWVWRHVAAGGQPEYDVFDRTGRRLRTIVLSRNSAVVGFGAGVVYVARTDEYDLQWLEKYRL